VTSVEAVGVVVVAHGGQVSSTEATMAVDPAVVRMIPVAAAIRRALRGSGAEVFRPRFGVRGWNGEQASPVHDLNRMLDEIRDTYGPVPVVLVGHSMGGRAVLRAAGHPSVTAVAGLAPWLPLGEPVAQLAGRWVLLAHGSADGITSPEETWAYAERARTEVQPRELTVIEVRGTDHAMLRRARLWHALAANFARTALDLPGHSPLPGHSTAPGSTTVPGSTSLPGTTAPGRAARPSDATLAAPADSRRIIL